jgi:transposase
MNLHLQLISQQAASGVQIVLIMDGAGWHRSHDLVVPDNITLYHLPPYSPDLNPVERLWLWLKERFFSNRSFLDLAEILAAGAAAWSTLDESRIRSVCRVSWLELLHP